MRAALEGRVLALLGIVLLSLGMRTPTSGFSPLFGQADAELHLGSVVLGIVGAVPLLAFAASGSVAPRFARRFGLEIAVVGAIAAIIVGQAARALAPGAVVVVAGTVLATVGIGIANVLLPPAVKRYFPDRIGLVSAVYITLYGVSASTPGFLATPLSTTIGWRGTLFAWAVTVVLAAIPWLLLSRRPRLATGPIDIVVPESPRPRLRRSPVAWALVLVMFGSACAGYVDAAWYPRILEDVLGLSSAEAAVQSGILFAVGIAPALLVPPIGTRPRVAGALVLLAALCGLAGWGGLLLFPEAPTVIWSVVIGLAGLTFPLVLTQIASRAATPRIAARLSGFVQGIAYVSCSAVVFGIGLVHTASGGWVAPLIVMLVISIVPLPAVVLLARPARVAEGGSPA